METWSDNREAGAPVRRSSGTWKSPLRAALYLLFAVGGLLYQSYGLPEIWESDPLSWIVSNMIREGSAIPDSFYYPAGLLIHASHLLTLSLSWLGLVSPTDPGAVTQVFRTVNLVFYLLTLYCMEGTVKIITRRRFANLALFMAGTTCGLLHHAHMSAANPSFFFGITFAIYQFSRTLISRRPRDFYLAVCASSLAVGCKYNAIHLFGALPLLWLFCFLPVRWPTFFKHSILSLALAPLPFYLTNPGHAFAANKAWADMRKVAVDEAPHFQNPLPLSELIDLFWQTCHGFFSPLVNTLMLATLCSALAIFLVCIPWRKHIPWRQADRLAAEGLALLALLFVSCAILTYKISIFQSRYLIPFAIYYCLTFLILWYWLPGLARRTAGAALPYRLDSFNGLLRRAAVAARALLVATIALMLGATGIAQVYTFAADPRESATRFVEAAVHRLSPARIGLISYPRRSAFRRGLPELESSIDEFVTMLPPADEGVDTWPEYFQEIRSFFEDRSVDFVLMEEIIMSWPVFLPKKDSHDYSRRLAYPNPGPQEWCRQMAILGFQLDHVITGPDEDGIFPRLLHRLIGKHYLRVVEARGRNIYVFRRRAAGPIAQRTTA